MIITFAGLAGTGKSMLAKMLADSLGIPHHNIGLMFRKIALLSRSMELCDINNLASLNVSYTDDYLCSEIVGLEAAALAEKNSSIMATIVQAKIKDNNFVCDGRTAGTEIYPEADIKFFLTCLYQERCRRRNAELSFRDELDLIRLKIPEGAYLIDTDDKTPEELLQEVLRYEEKMIF